MEQLGSEDDACETEDHGSGSDGDIEEGLLLSKNSSGESCEAVRDRKTDDLHAAFVLRERGYESVIVSGCPEQISGSRV